MNTNRDFRNKNNNSRKRNRKEDNFQKMKKKKESIVDLIGKDFDVWIPLLSWAGMSENELIDVYNELAEENGMPLYCDRIKRK